MHGIVYFPIGDTPHPSLFLLLLHQQKMPGAKARMPRIAVDQLSFLAKQAMRRQNYTEALRIYYDCIDGDPCDGRAYVGIGRIELRRGNTTGARAIYMQGLKYCYDNPFLLQVKQGVVGGMTTMGILRDLLI